MQKVRQYFAERPALYPFAGYLLAVGGVALYAFITRPIVVGFGDSWIFIDMAKRFGINKSLSMPQVFDLVYPPLYALVISPAYAFFHSERVIFFAISLINTAVYSAVFYPFYGLLHRYSGLPPIAAFCAALLLSFSPCTLHYSKWILSETLYIPLVAVFFYWTFLEKHFGTRADQLLFALLLAALPLTKAVGAVPVIAFFILAAGQCAGVVDSARGGRGKWGNVILILALFIAFMLLKRAWYHQVVPNPAAEYADYLNPAQFPQMFSPVFWLDRLKNLGAYILLAPHLVTGFFVVWIVAGNLKLLLSDPFLFMTAVTLAGHLAVIPVFTSTDPSGVYHSRYLAPFMFALPLAGIKYLGKFDRKSFTAVCAGLLLMFAAGWPANLKPFASSYSDGIFFTADVFGGPGWLISLAYLLIMISASYTIYRRSDKLRVAAVFVVFLTIVGNSAQVLFNMGVPTFRSYDCGGIGAAVIDQLNGPERPEFYVDSGWRGDPSWVKSARVMLMVPAVPLYASPEQVMDKKNSVFLTYRSAFAGARLLKTGAGLSLFRID